MKIIEALKKLPEEIREAAIKNHEKYKQEEPTEDYEHYEYKDPLGALCDAFLWSDTPEGEDFWRSEARKLDSQPD